MIADSHACRAIYTATVTKHQLYAVKAQQKALDVVLPSSCAFAKRPQITKYARNECCALAGRAFFEDKSINR